MTKPLARLPKLLLCSSLILLPLHAVLADGTVQWAFTTYGDVVSSPAIAPDGTIYVGSEDQNAASAGLPSPSGYLYAIAPSGAKKWVFQAADWIDSTPAVGPDGTIYVGSFDGNLYALNPASGAKKWAYSTRKYLSTSYIYSSPAVGADGTIYIGGGDSNLHAVNPDGSEKWIFTAGDWIDSSPAVGPDGTVYVGSWDNSLYALNPATGAAKWSFATGGSILGSPTVSPDGIIYIASRDKTVYALTPGGNPIWAYVTDDAIEASPALGPDGTIYIGSTNEGAAGDGVLYALNPDGSLKWKYAVGQGIFSSAAVRADGSIVVGTSKNSVIAVSSSGSLLWSYATGDYVDSSPTVAPNGTVYIGSDDGKLYALNGNGQPLAGGAWPQFRQNLIRTGLLPTSSAFSNPGRLINLSARANVTASPNNLVVGFVIGGASKSILLRGVGPTLSQYGITNPLPDPVLQLYNSSSTVIASNTTGWGGSATLSNAFQQVGAFPYMSSTSMDEALLEPSLQGLYTAQVSPAASAGGVALAEIYDADTGVPPGRLVNISARANVSAGQNVLIAGFVIGGQTAQTVLVRGIGPALANYGVSNYLAQPQLTLYETTNNNPVVVAQNSGWSTAPNAQQIAATGAAVQAFTLTSGSADCALLLTLPPGLYTAQVATGNGASGVALAEVYLVP